MKSYKLIVTTKASEEYSDAFWFYEEARPALGNEFEKEIVILFELIRKIHFFFPADSNIIGKHLSGGFHFLLSMKSSEQQ